MSIKINNDTANGSSTLQPSNTATGDVTHTLPEFTTELAPRMQLMTAQNSTSGTAIDFTGIPSWAKKITVMFSGVSLSASSHIIVQVGSGSITSSGYRASSTIAFPGAPYTLGLTTTTGFVIYQNNNTYISDGAMSIVVMSGNLFVETHTLGVSTYSIHGGGSVTLSSTLDRIRITTVNGTDTFDAGQINILYEG